jgi:hypothetical protein
MGSSGLDFLWVFRDFRVRKVYRVFRVFRD